MKKIYIKYSALLFSALLLGACSNIENSPLNVSVRHLPKTQGQLSDQIMAITLLSEQQREWSGTPYRLGGLTQKGVDCSGFVQRTFKDRFGIALPRTTREQATRGQQIKKSEIQTGDLVFFKTGRGPNGYHVGIYVKDGQFLHASTKGGVIYSSMNSPYWSRTYWQARRL